MFRLSSTIRRKYHLPLVCLICLVTYQLKAQLIFKKEQYLVDKKLHLIICNRPPTTVPANTTSILFDKTYSFHQPISSVQIGLAYEVSADNVDYKLYFTHLPLINITVKNTIGDTYENGAITIADTAGKAFESTMGIKIRGAYSRTFPKKSYHLQLWTDSTGTTTQNKSFFGMRSDQTWLLLAMYNEKLRLNNKTAHDLWLKMDTLYYAQQEPDAHADIRSKYVEVFQNSAYQGIYIFTEDLDRNELGLKKATPSQTGGELYAGKSWDQGTLFTGLAPRPTAQTQDWSGWELDYPNTTNWFNLYQFTDFVINAPDSTFKQQISQKIRQDNFADYYIFLNLLRAEDNTGKNLYLARYDQNQPYFISPWDLDGTWGYYWDGSRRNIIDDVLSNTLFNRLLAVSPNFKLQTAMRWFSLRKTRLSIDSLTHAIDVNYSLLQTNGVYERENLVWPGPLLSYSGDELTYIKTWTSQRVHYLDSYFETLAQSQAAIFSFTATAVQQTAVLNWRVNCMAVSSFTVERSSDSLRWHTVNTSPIQSTDSLPCQYSFVDNNPSPGNVFYRLKIKDKQNNSLYTPTRLLNFDLPASVFPNPASTTVQIVGNIDKVNLYSLMGALLYESPAKAVNAINVNALTTGMYILRVFQKNGAVSTHKLLINRE